MFDAVDKRRELEQRQSSDVKLQVDSEFHLSLPSAASAQTMTCSDGRPLAVSRSNFSSASRYSCMAAVTWSYASTSASVLKVARLCLMKVRLMRISVRASAWSSWMEVIEGMRFLLEVLRTLDGTSWTVIKIRYYSVNY